MNSIENLIVEFISQIDIDSFEDFTKKRRK